MAMADDFDLAWKQKALEADRMITGYLPKEEGLQRMLLRAMNYSVRSGGKRLRPVLMRETCCLYGGRQDEVIAPFMAAMEMIHTSSLVHDDLPAMDDDHYRRGKETTHVVFGESMAILAGDGLLNLAYETAAQAFAVCPGDKDVEKAFAVLGKKAGIYGMIGGQSLDVQMDGQPLDEEMLQFIYKHKTGALIEGSLMVGALLAGTAAREVECLERIGDLTGVAFQIQDDILDIVGDEAVLGKPLHSDEKHHKTTYVSLYGVEESRRVVAALSDEAVAQVDQLDAPGDKTFLKQLILYLAGRDR